MTLTIILGITAVIYATTLIGFWITFKKRERQIMDWEVLDRGDVK